MSYTRDCLTTHMFVEKTQITKNILFAKKQDSSIDSSFKSIPLWPLMAIKISRNRYDKKFFSNGVVNLET